MTRMRIDGALEVFECERCDCVIALVDTTQVKPDFRAGSYITGQPEPREGCDCGCHVVYRMMRKVAP